MSRLLMSSIRKSFGSTTVLHDIDLDVADGSFCALLGPSGSGKTTILNLIAGLEPVDAGAIELDDRSLTGLPPERRNIGVVFQNYALFPHLSVADNIAYGLKARKIVRAEQRARVAEILDLVGLTGYHDRKPGQLSGGQQQRVALARALVIKPDLLLLDEPLSALDRKVRGDMQGEIARIHRETGVTTVMVTHDQEEALSLADQVVLLNDGVIQQRDTPERIYRNPANPFVADFMGVQHFRGRVRAADGVLAGAVAAGSTAATVVPESSAESPVLDVAGLRLAVPEGAPNLNGRGDVDVAIAAEAVSVRHVPTGTDNPAMGLAGQRATVRRVVFQGSTAEVIISVSDGPEIRALLLSQDAVGLTEGDEVHVSIDPTGVQVWSHSS